MNEKIYILIKISLKLVPKGPIYNMSALVRVLAWCRTGDKPLPEPMLMQFTDTYAVLGGYDLRKRAMQQWTGRSLVSKACCIVSDRLSSEPCRYYPLMFWIVLRKHRNISFLNTERMSVDEIILGRQEPACPTLSIPWLLMTWCWKELVQSEYSNFGAR